MGTWVSRPSKLSSGILPDSYVAIPGGNCNISDLQQRDIVISGKDHNSDRIYDIWEHTICGVTRCTLEDNTLITIGAATEVYTPEDILCVSELEEGIEVYTLTGLKKVHSVLNIHVLAKVYSFKIYDDTISYVNTLAVSI